MSESIDELTEGLDVNSSNDTTTKEVKDFKKAVIKSIDKFNSCIKHETKNKDIAKEHIERVDAIKNTPNMMLIINKLLMLILRYIKKIKNNKTKI